MRIRGGVKEKNLSSHLRRGRRSFWERKPGGDAKAIRIREKGILTASSGGKDHHC